MERFDDLTVTYGEGSQDQANEQSSLFEGESSEDIYFSFLSYFMQHHHLSPETFIGSDPFPPWDLNEASSSSMAAPVIHLAHNPMTVHALPPELLSFVFEDLRDTWKPTESQSSRRSGSSWITTHSYNLGWILVTHVCRRWRLIALDMRRLWSEIDCPRLPPSWAPEMLLRAEGASLNVTLDFERGHPDQTRPFLQSLISPNLASTIRSLTLDDVGSIELDLLHSAEGELTAVQYLELSQDAGEPIRAAPVLFSAPSLRELKLVQYFLPLDSIDVHTFSSLTQLTIECRPDFSEPGVPYTSAAQVKSFLESLASLEGLFLEDAIPLMTLEETPGRFDPDFVINLAPGCKSAQIHGDECVGLLPFAAHIVMPLDSYISIFIPGIIPVTSLVPIWKRHGGASRAPKSINFTLADVGKVEDREYRIELQMNSHHGGEGNFSSLMLWAHFDTPTGPDDVHNVLEGICLDELLYVRLNADREITQAVWMAMFGAVNKVNQVSVKGQESVLNFLALLKEFELFGPWSSPRPKIFPKLKHLHIDATNFTPQLIDSLLHCLHIRKTCGVPISGLYIPSYHSDEEWVDALEEAVPRFQFEHWEQGRPIYSSRK